MAETIWDGLQNSYIPGDKLNISSKVKLHKQSDEEIDPITYEVLRHTMWTINDEHGITIGKVSGSPAANIAQDFNPSLWTEDGETVFFGPYIQYLNAAGGMAIKWVLEHLGDNPGINPGDMFLTNDPWIGACHQPDVALLSPVFYGEEIFCWVSNTLHQYDVGGSTPGSFCPDPIDVFSGDPVPIPPIKIVEGGMIRRDIEGEYVRRSRTPYLVSLDLRAQIAGANGATRRIESLINEYGAPIVKGAMHKVIDSSEASFVGRIKNIPDGTWSEETYVECAVPGDRNIYKQVVNLTKKGDMLIFDNRGTDGQVKGALNCTYVGWRGGIMSAVAPHFAFDQLFAIGGAERHIRFEPTPGTMTCASFPAAVSTATLFVVITTIGLANNCIARMMSTDPEQKANIIAVGGPSSWPVCAMSGVDQVGSSFGGFLLDEVIGGIGAMSFRDGIDSGGNYWMPAARAANVENNESAFPILYLWRKEVADSGGAGKFRGGNSGESAYIVQGAESMTRDVVTSAVNIPTGPGLFGGHPGCQHRSLMIRDTNVRELFGKKRIPETIEELSGSIEQLPPKARNVHQGRDDVYTQRWTAAGGYGDPLDREAELVAHDVVNGAITRRNAMQSYGVVLTEDFEIDIRATVALRDDRRSKGKGLVSSECARSNGPVILGSMLEHLRVERHDDKVCLVCIYCGHQLCRYDENFKHAAKISDRPLESISDLNDDPSRFVDADIVFREFTCPGCGHLLASEICRREDKPRHDSRIEYTES